MSDEIIPIDNLSETDAELLLEVTRLRNKGFTEMQILMYLVEQKSVAPAKVGWAFNEVRRQIGQAVADFNPAMQAMQGILNAQDAHADASKIHDTKGRIAAENMRFKWVKFLTDHLK